MAVSPAVRMAVDVVSMPMLETGRFFDFAISSIMRTWTSVISAPFYAGCCVGLLYH